MGCEKNTGDASARGLSLLILASSAQTFLNTNHRVLDFLKRWCSRDIITLACFIFRYSDQIRKLSKAKQASKIRIKMDQRVFSLFQLAYHG